jgi:hypothetical protein
MYDSKHWTFWIIVVMVTFLALGATGATWKWYHLVFAFLHKDKDNKDIDEEKRTPISSPTTSTRENAPMASKVQKSHLKKNNKVHDDVETTARTTGVARSRTNSQSSRVLDAKSSSQTTSEATPQASAESSTVLSSSEGGPVIVLSPLPTPTRSEA